METKKIIGHSVGDAMVRDSKAKESKSKEKRAAISARKLNAGIVDYLATCSEGEADATCAIVRFVKGTLSMLDADRKVVNTYLDAGYLHFSSFVTMDDVREHRLKRARVLREKLHRFFASEQYQKANDALYDIALNKSDIEAFMKLRQSMKSSREPASNTVRNACADQHVNHT